MKTDNVINLIPGRIPPVKAHSDDAAIDLVIQEDFIIAPGETIYAKAGVALDLVSGFAGHVISRSSVFKRGLAVVPTLVDPGYKGEISTIVTNVSQEPVKVLKGDRLGQLILMPYFQFKNEDVILPDSKGERDPNAKFGSSGTAVLK